MRKVTVKLEFQVILSVNEGIELAEVINELDYQLTDTTDAADIVDVQMMDYESAPDVSGVI